MRKLIKKAAILSLVLVLLLAASATAFALTSWNHIWTASDEETNVEYDCSIYSTGTDGSIYSQTNQGEVYAEVSTTYYFDVDEDVYGYEHRYDIGYEYAVVSIGYGGNAERALATYSFNAYVDTTGEEFQSGAFTLTYNANP